MPVFQVCRSREPRESSFPKGVFLGSQVVYHRFALYAISGLPSSSAGKSFRLHPRCRRRGVDRRSGDTVVEGACRRGIRIMQMAMTEKENYTVFGKIPRALTQAHISGRVPGRWRKRIRLSDGWSTAWVCRLSGGGAPALRPSS